MTPSTSSLPRALTRGKDAGKEWNRKGVIFVVIVVALLVGENDWDVHNADADDDDGDDREDDKLVPPSFPFFFFMADLGEGVNGEEGVVIAVAALAAAEAANEAFPLVLPEEGRGGRILFVYIIVAIGLGENRMLPSLPSTFRLRCRCCCCCNCCCCCAAVIILV